MTGSDVTRIVVGSDIGGESTSTKLMPFYFKLISSMFFLISVLGIFGRNERLLWLLGTKFM